MAKNNGFHVSVKPFDGDPNKLNPFLNQLSHLISSNKLSEQEVVLFMPNFLEGNALDVYYQNIAIRQFESFEEIANCIREFFTPVVTRISSRHFENFQILQAENIKNAILRFDAVAIKTFPELSLEALNAIKLKKLIEIVPSPIRIKILENNTSSYSEAVETAIEFQKILSTDQEIANNRQMTQEVNLMATEPSTSKCVNSSSQYSDSIDKTLNERNSANSNKNVCNAVEQHSNRNESNRFNRSRFPRKSNRNVKNHSDWNSSKASMSRNNNERNDNFKNYISKRNANSARFNPKNNVMCQFCEKRGHVATDCFHVKNIMKNNSDKNKFVHRKNGNSSNNHPNDY